MAQGSPSPTTSQSKNSINFLTLNLMAESALSMFRDDDEPDRFTWKDYLAAMILGPVNAVPILGSFVEMGVRKLAGGKVYVNSSNPLENGASNLTRKIPQIYKDLSDDKDNEQTVNEIIARNLLLG